MTEARRYWFPAKRYGWGWGPPQTWQGRLVMLVFVALLLVGLLEILPRWGTLSFLAYSGLLCVCLVLVCWWQGEPPRWHWSGDARGK